MASHCLPASCKRKRPNSAADQIVWPPAVVIENTRVAKNLDGRWTGIGNLEMACFLQEIGHTEGRPKSVWGKEGHRGQVIVCFAPTLQGLQAAQRLHDHFKKNKRDRDSWFRVKPLWHGLPGVEAAGEEGPDFVRFDEKTSTLKRVLYGYLATASDLDKFSQPKKKRKAVETVNVDEIKAKLLLNPTDKTQIVQDPDPNPVGKVECAESNGKL